MTRLVAAQDFHWHDAGHGATYLVGEYGYLVMDGARGRVDCSRRLARPMRGPEDALELRLRVVLGKPYSITLLSAPQQPAAHCLIDADGRVRLPTPAPHQADCGSLTFQRGQPYCEPAKRKWYVVESDEHCLRFERFDFTQRSFVFRLDEREPVTVKQGLAPNATSIGLFALATHEVAVGSMIRLREYVQYHGPTVVARERFPLHWRPIPPPPDGMPDDNVCETTLRPVDYHWLETRTQYGYVKVALPPLAVGTVEWEMKTTDVANESCLILEEDEGIIKGGNLQVGLLGGRMIFYGGGGEVLALDPPLELANDRVYHFQLSWDAEARVCRLWIDGQRMSAGGATALPWLLPPKRGIDTLTLHPGDAGARQTSLQKRAGLPPRTVPPLVTYWGRFRVYDSLL